MLLKKQVLDRIVTGDITLVFRRWKRPTVKTGGRLRTVVGVLDIQSVDEVATSDITKDDAKLAGFCSRQELLRELNRRQEGQLFRIALRFQGTDPRQALRQQVTMTNDECDELKVHLLNMDARSRSGSWTMEFLRQIAAHPGTRASDLARSLGLETRQLKAKVRRLKELGLTESLKVGYQLAPRGTALLRRIDSSAG